MSSQADTQTLLISCPDAAGIVAEVTACICRQGGNLIHLDQHTDCDTQTFYMRVEWEHGDGIAQALAPVAKRFSIHWQLHHSKEVRSVAILATRQDHCLWDLLQRQRSGELPMKVAMVISNHDHVRPVAEAFGVAFYPIDVAKSKKAQGEQAMLRLLHEAKVELVVLARYMQILSPRFVAAFPMGIINVHHSFLPAFTGTKPYHQAHERGVKIIGATSHYVTPDLDQGPIIAQTVQGVTHRDSTHDLVRMGRDLERVALARAVRLHLQNRILVYANKTAVFE